MRNSIYIHGCFLFFHNAAFSFNVGLCSFACPSFFFFFLRFHVRNSLVIMKVLYNENIFDIFLTKENKRINIQKTTSTQLEYVLQKAQRAPLSMERISFLSRGSGFVPACACHFPHFHSGISATIYCLRFYTC